MFKRTFENFSRTAHKYGDIHFISFLGAILARLAYFNDNKFLPNYEQIMGAVIPVEAMKAINAVPANNLKALLDDQTLFGLLNPVNPFKNYTYDFEGKKYIDFVKMNMPQKVNAINGEVTSYLQKVNPSGQVTYISLHWSNYGEVYIVADKRMPNTIFVLFRGTYSAKTFALYAKPTSVIPLKICDTSPDTFLYGIMKPTLEMIHTITESIRYLAVNVLKQTQPDSVKIFTTGHSLGGAMCTDFTYLWTKAIKTTKFYNSGQYAIISKNVICVSLGSPRNMGELAAKSFCDLVKTGQVLYLRITSRGDPVAAVPPSQFGFEHPCSSDENMRKQVVEDCNSLLIARPFPNVNYAGNLDCTSYKTRIYLPNMLSHTVYLDIMYTKAMNPINFMRGIGTQREILRNKAGSTFARIILSIPENVSIPNLKTRLNYLNETIKKAGNNPDTNNVKERNMISNQLRQIEETGTVNFFRQIFFNVDAARTVITKDDFQLEQTLSQTSNTTNLVTQEITKEQQQAQSQGQPVPAAGGGLIDMFNQKANVVNQQVNQSLDQMKQKAANMQQQVSNIKQQATQQVNNMKQQANNAIQKKFGKKVVEDSKMTAVAFDSLIRMMKNNRLPDKAPLYGPGGPDAPITPQGMYAPNSVFANQLAPEVGCPAVPGKGGRKSKKRKRRRNRRTRRRKRI